jgi:hypothetical protein
MKIILTACLFSIFLLAACSSSNIPYTPAPTLELISTEGESFLLNKKSSRLIVVFVSLDDPAALNRVHELESRFSAELDILVIPRSHDRQFMISNLQQQTLLPIILDSKSTISSAFGNIIETPALFLIQKGKILLQQQLNIDTAEISRAIRQ